jgi:hypothetical protein
MPAIFLPFDQAALYNIVTELLAEQTIGWLKQRRQARRGYVRQVAEDTVTNAAAHGISVDPKAVISFLGDQGFWDRLSAKDTQALRLRLISLIASEDDSSQDVAAALLAAVLAIAALRQLPAEQVPVNELNHLEATLNSVFGKLQEAQAEVSPRFFPVTELRRADNPLSHGAEIGMAQQLAPSPRSKSAATLCLAQLLRLQYPWGEWSDHRNELESMMMERPSNVTVGLFATSPLSANLKPNVADSLFALEALEFFQGRSVDVACSRAIKWMKSHIVDGWFREWSQGLPPTSETHLTEIISRADVRHTAQVLTACSRWQDSRDPIASLVRNISNTILPETGLWPNTPHEPIPRLLASVFAVEALQTVASDHFRMPLSDLLDQPDQIAARRALRRGIVALLSDCEQGQGLVGGMSSGPNPYLTGIALFRLAHVARQGSELAYLSELMVQGLLDSAQEYGWEDSAIPQPLRARTRLRTTLRCAVGLARANSAGIKVPSALLEHALQLAEVLVTSGDNELLDSPDYACGLIGILLGRRDIVPQEILESTPRERAAERQKRLSAWRNELASLIAYLQPYATLNIPGYSIAIEQYQTRLYSLS